MNNVDDLDNIGVVAEEARGFPAIRWGLVFGIMLTVLGLLPTIWLLTNGYRVPLDTSDLEKVIRDHTVLLGEYALCNLVATIALYFLAGFMTARDVGAIKPGMFAAGLAYVASSLVTILANLVTLRQAEDSALSAFGNLADQLRGPFAALTALDTTCNLIVGAVMAGLIGALGALLGCAIFGRASYT